MYGCTSTDFDSRNLLPSYMENIKSFYWLATPGYIATRCMIVEGDKLSTGSVTGSFGYYRPIICLKSNVSLNWDSNKEAYTIE